MKLIDADNLTKNLTYDIANHPIHGNFKITMASVRAAISNAPTVDAVPVVRCKDCVSHGNCLTEDTFRIASIENPYCCGGKRKEDNT